MTTVNKVEKVDQLSLLDIVKYQLITYCYFEKIAISDAAAICYAYLCINGEMDLTHFCNAMMNILDDEDKPLFASPQVVRNTVTKGELSGVKEKLIIKTGDHRKKICINPALKIQCSGTILIDFKFLHHESTQSESSVS